MSMPQSFQERLKEHYLWSLSKKWHTKIAESDRKEPVFSQSMGQFSGIDVCARKSKCILFSWTLPCFLISSFFLIRHTWHCCVSCSHAKRKGNHHRRPHQVFKVCIWKGPKEDECEKVVYPELKVVTCISMSLANKVIIYTTMLAPPDYYQILSLKRDCSEADVRLAYRKLALKVCLFTSDTSCNPWFHFSARIILKEIMLLVQKTDLQ